MLPGRLAALGRAVDLPAPARLADVETPPASRASPVPQRIHRPPAGNDSRFTGPHRCGETRGAGERRVDLTVCAVPCERGGSDALRPGPRRSHGRACPTSLDCLTPTSGAAAGHTTTDGHVSISTVLKVQRQLGAQLAQQAEHSSDYLLVSYKLHCPHLETLILRLDPVPRRPSPWARIASSSR